MESNGELQKLKDSVRRFRDVDDELRRINKRVFELREKRKMTEMEISDYLKSPYFAQHTVMELEDGSRIKIQRPQTWSKGWSISKKDLWSHITNYFANTNKPTAEACYEFVVQEEKENSISDDFKLTRFVRDENIENE